MLDAVEIKVDPPNSHCEKAVSSGVAVSIDAADIGDDAAVVLRLIGPIDRVMFVVTDLAPKNQSIAEEAGYPIPISWGLMVGTSCLLDRSALVSGLSPDVMELTSATDRRSGVLYHAANLLAGQWALCAAVDPAKSAVKYTAKISIVFDHLGGGGPLSVYKGGVFG